MWRALRALVTQIVVPLADPMDYPTVTLALEPHHEAMESTLRMLMLTHDQAVVQALEKVQERAAEVFDADAEALRWMFED